MILKGKLDMLSKTMDIQTETISDKTKQKQLSHQKPLLVYKDADQEDEDMNLD